MLGIKAYTLPGLPKESSDFYEQDLRVIDLTKGEQVLGAESGSDSSSCNAFPGPNCPEEELARVLEFLQCKER